MIPAVWRVGFLQLIGPHLQLLGHRQKLIRKTGLMCGGHLPQSPGALSQELSFLA